MDGVLSACGGCVSRPTSCLRCSLHTEGPGHCCRPTTTGPHTTPHHTTASPHLEHCCEEVAVAVLILAPVLKVLKQRVQLVVGVALQVAVDGDVAPVANLLAEVGRVKDELGLEKGVLPVCRGGMWLVEGGWRGGEDSCCCCC